MSKKRNQQTARPTYAQKHETAPTPTKPKRSNKKCMCGHGRKSHDNNGKGFCKKCECVRYYTGGRA